MKNMNTIMTDAVNGMDLDLIEEFINTDEKYAAQNRKMAGQYAGGVAATAACAVLVLGAALNVPKFISPGINDPSVPPVVSTEGGETPIAAGTNKETAENTGVPTVESTKAHETSDFGNIGRSSYCIYYECEREYDINAEFVEIKLYYGMPEHRFDYSEEDYKDISPREYFGNIDFYVFVNYNSNDQHNNKGKDHIIKTIMLEDFITDKYLYSENWENRQGVLYMYSETVQIPTSVFKEDFDGCLTLSLCTHDPQYENPNTDRMDWGDGTVTGISYKISEDKIIMMQDENISVSYENYIVKEK